MIISDLADAFERHFKLDSGTLVSVAIDLKQEWAEFGFISKVTGMKEHVAFALDEGHSYNQIGKSAAQHATEWLTDHHGRVKV